MNKLTALLLLGVLLAVCQAEVVQLDDSNFTSYIKANPYVFVKFYAPWCGHCKSMIPEYQKLAELAEGKEFKVVKVDATVAKETSTHYGVEGFPTLQFIAQNQSLPYEGGRTAQDISKWIDQFFSNKLATITENELKIKIGTEDFLLIQGASAQQLSTLSIASFLDQSVEYYLLETPAGADFKITLYLKNSKTFEFTGQLTSKDLVSWSVKNSMPVVVPLKTKQATAQVFQNENKIPAFLLYRGTDFTDELFANYESICEQNKDKFLCSYVGSEHSVYAGVARYFKVQEDKKDVSVLGFMSNELKSGYFYPLPLTFSNEGATQFIADVAQGKIESFIESKEQPSEIKYVDVTKLTDETFNSTLKDNKYVFVEFYSPTCGHCLSFAPEYEKLAAQVKQQGKPFVIAAVDLAEHRQTIGQYVDVNGFPTLNFYVNGVPLTYNGPRTPKDILNYMQTVIQTKLQAAASVEEIVKPSVVLFNVPEDSPLHLLPSQFTTVPIYNIPDASGTFKASYYGKEIHNYQGESSLSLVLQWLEDVATPVLFDALSDPPAKKLTEAIQTKKPLVIVVHREQSGDKAIQVLQQFCPGSTEVACGVARSTTQGFAQFNQWLGDTQSQKSRIVTVNPEDFSKHYYDGSIAQLTEDNLSSFIKKIVEQAKAAQQKAREQEEKHQAEQQSGETQENAQEQAPATQKQPVAQAVEEKNEEL